MEILSINLEKGCGIREESATGVRIIAGKRFLEEVAKQNWETRWMWSASGRGKAQEISNARIVEIKHPSRTEYSIDLSYKSASYLLECIGHYASIWKGQGFEYAPMVRSALALERHLTKYGLPQEVQG